MFSFYGSKARLAKFYPEPLYDTIIEPFAGSAGYSLHGDRWERKVILCDIDPVICGVWDFLIHASPSEILRLPDISDGEKLDKHADLPRLALDLIGLCVNCMSSYPKRTASRGTFNYWNRMKPRIAGNLYKIRHWEIRNVSYDDIENIAATWFVDPPYQYTGRHYRFSKIDYSHLVGFCGSRNGQVIVCEKSPAGWLDFKPLARHIGSSRVPYTEVFWERS